MGNVLVRTLLETNQEIPDFLGRFRPEGLEASHVKFETESDWDEHEAAMTGNAGGAAGGDDPWATTEDNADGAARDNDADPWAGPSQSSTGDDVWAPDTRQLEQEPAW